MEKCIGNLLIWQKRERAAGRSRAKRCLEAVRRALFIEDLNLPYGDGVHYDGRLAIDNFRALVHNPAKFGWRATHSPLSEVCLCYFKRSGRLKDGRIAGHVAIYDPETKTIYSNINYKWSQYWADRIVGAFVPT